MYAFRNWLADHVGGVQYPPQRFGYRREAPPQKPSKLLALMLVAYALPVILFSAFVLWLMAVIVWAAIA